MITYTSDTSLYIWSSGSFKSILTLHHGILLFPNMVSLKGKTSQWCAWVTKSVGIPVLIMEYICSVLDNFFCMDRHVECLKVIENKYYLYLLVYRFTDVYWHCLCVEKILLTNKLCYTLHFIFMYLGTLLPNDHFFWENSCCFLLFYTEEISLVMF